MYVTKCIPIAGMYVPKNINVCYQYCECRLLIVLMYVPNSVNVGYQ